MEQEVKILLEGRGAYLRMARVLGRPVTTCQQDDLYFDTPDHQLFRVHRGALRVRRCRPGSVQVTFKWKADLDERGFLVAIEEEAPLDENTWLRLLGEGIQGVTIPLLAHVQERVGGRLELVGQTATLRETYRGPGGFPWILDATCFPDGSMDYELEIEVERKQATAVLSEFRRLAATNAIAWRTQTQTKLHRLLARLDRKQSDA